MALRDTPADYGKISQILHWLIATLIMTMSVIGVTLAIIEKSIGRTTLLTVHIGVGGVLSVLILIRIVWKAGNVTPNPPDGLSPLHVLGFRLTHIFLNSVAIALVASGIIMALNWGMDILPIKTIAGIYIGRSTVFYFHILMFTFLMGLIGGHVGGVIIYQVTKSDVLSRMG
ncbi:cytochrome b/b6 domain-containing protein, partial [bacterium]|nr:cytochrome b/b6 domain-containing protein [bacterium]